jgi:predicted MFS family arabinose efflux permease
VPNPGSDRTASFTSVVKAPGFVPLWLAQAVSVTGDQFARVALALLVFDRTGSPGWTALAWAVTFLADLLGGLFLAGLADRYPYRAVLVCSDVARAGLVAVLLLQGLPIWALVAVVFAVQLGSAPFTSARMVALPLLLTGDRYLVGVGVLNTTYQTALLIGLPLGGALAAVIGSQGLLLLDVGTFAVSAVLVLVGLSTAPKRDDAGPEMTPWRRAVDGARLIAGAPRLRSLLGLACVAGFYIAPEAVAVPYAGQIGAGTAAVGWLLAANPVGTVVGNIVLARFVRPAWRLRLLGPLAVASSVVLLPVAAMPGLAVSLVLWTLCGLASSHDMVTSAEFVRSVPEGARGQAFGLASSALRVAQGAGIVATGWVAEAVGPAAAIGIAAALGTVAAVAAALSWRRAGAPVAGDPVGARDG